MLGSTRSPSVMFQGPALELELCPYQVSGTRLARRPGSSDRPSAVRAFACGGHEWRPSRTNIRYFIRLGAHSPHH